MKTFKTDKTEVPDRIRTGRKAKRQFCVFLALIMLFGIMPAALPVFAAEEGDSQSKLEEIRETIMAISYNDYISAKPAGPNGELLYGSG